VEDLLAVGSEFWFQKSLDDVYLDSQWASAIASRFSGDAARQATTLLKAWRKMSSMNFALLLSQQDVTTESIVLAFQSLEDMSDNMEFLCGCSDRALKMRLIDAKQLHRRESLAEAAAVAR
jgi:hypothetical protein